jgi:hypothetical protein
MRHNPNEVPRHHWLVRYYRAQLRFYLRALTGLRILPRPIAMAGHAWLRRTQIPKRGTAVNVSTRSKIVVPAMVVLGVVALIVTLVVRWQTPDHPSSAPPSADITLVPGPTPVRLDAWARPTTTDPREFAIAYGRAIWTYNTMQQDYNDWQVAVSSFADQSTAAPRIATSMLPQWPEYSDLQRHKARASVDTLSAEVTPELKAMAYNDQVPKVWHAYVVHGEQTVITDTDTRFLDRRAAVAVICVSFCKFWSATAQTSS